MQTNQPETVEIFRPDDSGLTPVLHQPGRWSSGQPISSVRWRLYNAVTDAGGTPGPGTQLATSRKQVFTVSLPPGDYYAHLDIYYVSGIRTSWARYYTISKPRKGPNAKANPLSSAIAAARVLNGSQRNKAEIKAFLSDVMAIEQVPVELVLLRGKSFTGAIRAPYSHHFPKPLTGKRSVVKQLLARLAEVLDTDKVVAHVLWPNGQVAPEQTHLSALRDF